MTASGQTGAAAARQKARYHHGDLREALIAAAYQLVSEAGADGFSLADACRRAGVSTAAPYRHFKDREELLAEVTARGFGALTVDTKAAVEAEDEGSLASIVAMGRAYVAFAAAQPGLFRLMFGQPHLMGEFPKVSETGGECFGYVIAQVRKYCVAHGVERDANEIAIKLWTFVHGASSLLIDGKYEKVTPGLDVTEMIVGATPLLVGHRD